MNFKQLLLIFIAGLPWLSCKTKTKINVQQQQSLKSKVEIIDPEGLNIFDTTARLETIAKDLNWSEGPLYINNGGYLLFSDVPENKIYKWKEEVGLSIFLTPSGNTGAPKPGTEEGSNGLLLDAEGSLVLCQQGNRRMAKMIGSLSGPRPEFVSLTDNYKGKRFNSPNDAVYRSNGDLYFTDPPYGLAKRLEDTAKELDFQGVYRLKPNGELDVVTKDLKYPNGIAFSPDGKFLFVASSDPANFVWMQYEMDTNGLAKNEKVFYEAHSYEGKNAGAPDGMKINKRGYVFATGPEGLWLFNPGGKLIARLYTGQLTSNCAFNTDESMLYLTCDDYVMRLKLKK